MLTEHTNELHKLVFKLSPHERTNNYNNPLIEISSFQINSLRLHELSLFPALVIEAVTPQPTPRRVFGEE